MFIRFVSFLFPKYSVQNTVSRSKRLGKKSYGLSRLLSVLATNTFTARTRVKLLDQEPSKVLIIRLKIRPSALESLQRLCKAEIDKLSCSTYYRRYCVWVSMFILRTTFLETANYDDISTLDGNSVAH